MRADVAAQTSTTAHAIENLYDSQGRRVQVVESILPPSSGWMPISDKIFLYDGWNLLRESDSANSTQHSYVWGIDASGTLQGAGGVGGLLWATADSQTYAAGYDANGNIIAWVNVTDGTLSGTREYGAFGENIAATGVGVLDEWSGIPFGFSTKYQDRLTGHYYYGYRFYDTSTGRWLSRDPIGEKGGLNLYGFVGNNGVNSWDLLGMMFPATEPKWPGPLAPPEFEPYCSSLAIAIEQFLNTREEVRAWRNYTSGSGTDIFLSSDEINDILSYNNDFKQKIENLGKNCSSKSGWSEKTFSVKGTTRDPWVLAIGSYDITVRHSCEDGCFKWEAMLNDPYDFDPLRRDETHRTESAENKTRAVAYASAPCYWWKSFNHVGVTHGKGSGCGH